MNYRIEKDSMGEMKIPENYLYGASTQRAVENFPVSRLRFSRVFIEALAALKGACAQANEELGLLDSELSQAIVKAAAQIEKGDFDEHFVCDIFQTGSGTSTNMNFNEVATNVVNKDLGLAIGDKSKVHPNDHINMGQSSNDTIPSAIHISAVLAVHRNLLPAADKMIEVLEKKSKEFESLVKIGRTHLQDATPLTLGQEFSGYAAQLRNAKRKVQQATEYCLELAIGGTAVGTGINTHPEFAQKVCALLKAKFGVGFKEAENHFESQASKDACVSLSGALKALAVSLHKIANDIRFLGSGPRCGLGELILPEVQPGSSIMPGKVNPVIAESMLMVCAQVIGNDAAISFGGALGNFELNVMMPVICHNLLESIEVLSGAMEMMEEKCLRGITANKPRLDLLKEQSLMLATALAPSVGYDMASKIAKTAYKEDKTLREVARELTSLSEDELNTLLDPQSMVSNT